jgi:ubiquitin-conjugating enzyme E2 J2
MASAAASKRLRTEYRNLQKNPVENIVACPTESNILEWHYVIVGPKKTPYDGGVYHGIVKFPADYPFKPPSIQMLTPNGRFKTQTRLCLSMSDFHPESWNPLWSVSTILMGLFSFMCEETPTQGSMVTSTEHKRKAAADSLAFNCKNSTVCELFPDFVEQYNEQCVRQCEERAASALNPTTIVATGDAVQMKEADILGSDIASWTQLAGLVGVLGIFLYAIMQLAAL